MIASALTLALVQAVAASPLASSAPSKPACASPKGNLTIHAANLYPEQADFDTKRCVTYISNLYKNTVTVYDAAENRVTNVINLPGITDVAAFHVSGVQIDKRHDKLTISANTGAAFDTLGADLSGTNFIVQYDLASNKIEWQNNLTVLSKGLYGGFQDIEHDAAGNSFVAEPWFLERGANQTTNGFSGIAAINDGAAVLVPDGQRGQLLR
ncbi:hypothetical protein LLEC1_08117, partial [Akanthomyces lecanii]